MTTEFYEVRRVLSRFLQPWNEAKLTLPQPGKDPKLPQNLRPISLLSMTSNLFEKAILHTVQRQVEEQNLLHASQFGFCSRHSTTFQCMSLLADHVTLNFSNNIFTAAIFSDIRKPLTLLGILYKIYELSFSARIIKIISSFLFN
jgi:hypothetical protein